MKKLIGGGVSVVTAVAAIAAVVRLGVPLPPGTEWLFTYVFATFGALFGYLAAAFVQNSWKQWQQLAFGALMLVLGPSMGYIYMINVTRPISPTMIEVCLTMGIPFILLFVAFYALAGLIGLKLTDSGGGE